MTPVPTTHRLLCAMVNTAVAGAVLVGAGNALGQTTAPQVVTIEGAVSFEIPRDWKLLNERAMRSAESRAEEQAAAAGWKVDLRIGQHLIFAPVSKKVQGNVLVALRASDTVFFSKSDLPTSTAQSLKPVVLKHFQVASDAFARAISSSGGRVISWVEPHPVTIGDSIGIESGSFYEQKVGPTVQRQIFAFAGSKVVTLTFSYLKESEAQFAPVYERVRSSLRLL